MVHNCRRQRGIEKRVWQAVSSVRVHVKIKVMAELSDYTKMAERA
ncbi:hypothetical protein LY39_01403 [Roseinatronobacter bogoriensis subsp. barguzinensis]|nr:hypothetical protein [Rhodobaca bogoriensis DSM 18756]TDW40368.1 hypothetical protein LY39_01403 [Rhodobaca barguzinensis]TDY70480.1 hypothetical protein EV660_102154 [Rhodobaca bogoriensis DSM 18756]